MASAAILPANTRAFVWVLFLLLLLHIHVVLGTDSNGNSSSSDDDKTEEHKNAKSKGHEDDPHRGHFIGYGGVPSSLSGSGSTWARCFTCNKNIQFSKDQDRVSPRETKTEAELQSNINELNPTKTIKPAVTNKSPSYDAKEEKAEDPSSDDEKKNLEKKKLRGRLTEEDEEGTEGKGAESKSRKKAEKNHESPSYHANEKIVVDPSSHDEKQNLEKKRLREGLPKEVGDNTGYVETNEGDEVTKLNPADSKRRKEKNQNTSESEEENRAKKQKN